MTFIASMASQMQGLGHDASAEMPRYSPRLFPRLCTHAIRLAPRRLMPCSSGTDCREVVSRTPQLRDTPRSDHAAPGAAVEQREAPPLIVISG